MKDPSAEETMHFEKAMRNIERNVGASPGEVNQLRSRIAELAEMFWPEDHNGEVVEPQFPDAETQLNRMLKLCERPTTKARVCFGGGEWEWVRGPDLLQCLEQPVPPGPEHQPRCRYGSAAEGRPPWKRRARVRQ